MSAINFLKRRVTPDRFKYTFEQAIDEFVERYLKSKDRFNRLSDESILSTIVSGIMHDLDFNLSNGGVDMYPFDEIWEFIHENFKDVILEEFNKRASRK
jgi:hypothetical protein